ncbi:MAG: PaaI family thioesterase [Alphaproteobacteria bacterium]
MTVGAVEELPSFLAQRPHIQHFNFKQIINDDRGGSVVLPFHERNLGNSMIGALHGGVVALALETAGLLTAFDADDGNEDFLVDIAHTTYLARTKPELLQAEARIVQSGARFLRLSARAFQDHGDVAQSILTISKGRHSKRIGDG